jgi:hypothetical protein
VFSKRFYLVLKCSIVRLAALAGGQQLLQFLGNFKRHMIICSIRDPRPFGFLIFIGMCVRFQCLSSLCFLMFLFVDHRLVSLAAVSPAENS